MMTLTLSSMKTQLPRMTTMMTKMMMMLKRSPETSKMIKTFLRLFLLNNKKMMRIWKNHLLREAIRAIRMLYKWPQASNLLISTRKMTIQSSRMLIHQMMT